MEAYEAVASLLIFTFP